MNNEALTTFSWSLPSPFPRASLFNRAPRTSLRLYGALPLRTLQVRGRGRRNRYRVPRARCLPGLRQPPQPGGPGKGCSRHPPLRAPTLLLRGILVVQGLIAERQRRARERRQQGGGWWWRRYRRQGNGPAAVRPAPVFAGEGCLWRRVFQAARWDGCWYEGGRNRALVLANGCGSGFFPTYRNDRLNVHNQLQPRDFSDSRGLRIG